MENNEILDIIISEVDEFEVSDDNLSQRAHNGSAY